MKNMHLVTGYAGTEHIKSEDDGSFNASFFGDGQFVMESGSQFEGSIIDNNTVRIFDGDLLMYGRHARIKPNAYEELTIETGTAGKNRNDLICVTYTKDTTTGVEDTYVEVIKGTESSGTASDPKYTKGNILEGATRNQMPLYRVKIEGVVLVELVPLFKLIPTYKTLAEKYEQEFIEACNSHLESLNVLDTMEEVTANTQANQIAGALAVKEGFKRVTTLETTVGQQSALPLPTSTFAYNITQNANNIGKKLDISVAGQQSALPLPQSTFAYNISKNAENIRANATAIEQAKRKAENDLENATKNFGQQIENVAMDVLENSTNLDTYLLGCKSNSATISASGYVSTTDTSSFVRYYKVGNMTCVQMSLLVTKEIPATTSINLVTGLPAAAISTIDFLHDLHGTSYSIQIDANGVNLHTYAYHQEAIPVNTRLIGTFWYQRKTL